MKKSTSNLASQDAPPPTGAGLAGGAVSGRPIRQLFRQLPALTQGQGGAGALIVLADSAESSMRTIHLGLAALGQLVARSSLDIQDGTVTAESMENLGFLMAELGDLASECMRIASECRSTAGARQGNADA